MSKRPVRIDDLLHFRIPFDVQIAPDGQSVLWSERRIDSEKGKTFANLVRARTGDEPRPFTTGPTVDGGARFSPDGRRVAFLRRVPGATPAKHQLCVIPTDGGEAHVLLEEPGTFMPPAWSPDGRTVVLPYRANDPLPEGDTEPLSIRVTRVHYKMDGQGYLPRDFFHLYRVEVDPPQPALARLTDGEWDDTDPAFSPDGTRVAFLSNRRGDHDLENKDLFVLPAGGGAPVQCTLGRGELFAPAWAPDGTWLACAGATGEKTIGLMRGRCDVLRVLPDGTHLEESLTPQVDRNPLNLTIDDVWGLEHMGRAPGFSRDGRTLIFPLSDSGQTDLCALDLGGTVRRIVFDRSVVTYSVAPAVGRVAFITTSPTEPGKIEVADLDGANRTVVGWPFRAYCEEVEIRAPQELAVQTPDGAAIGGWLLLPPGPGPFPMLLDIHGGPIVQFGRTFFLEHQIYCARGYAVLYVNPRGSQGYGVEFAKVIHRDWGDKPYVDLMAATDAAIATGKIDASRMGVMGGSYGGYMTNWVIAHTDRFKAACTQRTVSHMESLIWSDYGSYWGEELEAWPWEDPALFERLSPLTYAKNIRTPVLILQSLSDHRTPPDQGERMYVMLRVLGKEAEMVLFPGSGHDLSRNGPPRQRIERIQVIDEWFARKLGPKEERT